MFAFLAAANAGDLSHAYLGYTPTIQKTIEYAAPVAKTIYQPSLASPVIAKSVYEPEYNYHAYAAPTAYATGTVSHYGKTIATPHSIVNKYDSRLIHDDVHYKSLAYPTAYQAAAYPTAYQAAAYPTAYQTAAYPTVVKSPIVPTTVVKSAYAAPVAYAAQPTVVKSVAAPIYDHSYDHSYAHAAPVIAKAAVAYSPAVAVSHASFESAHGQYAW